MTSILISVILKNVNLNVNSFASTTMVRWKDKYEVMFECSCHKNAMDDLCTLEGSILLDLRGWTAFDILGPKGCQLKKQ